MRLHRGFAKTADEHVGGVQDDGMKAGGLCLSVFGAPLDTGNRGVEALGLSVLAGVAQAAPGSSVTLFDNGWGVRSGQRLEGLDLTLCGVRRSRRVHRPESWVNVRLSQRLGGLRNPVARRLLECDAVLDISGGDSFTDLYGPGRLQTVLEPKLAALRARRPLVLMPQTYGPFQQRGSRARAAAVVRGAAMALARDDESLAVLLDLLGSDADPARHRRAVDMAFALPPRYPERERHRQVVGLVERPRLRPLIGLNVSGLLWGGTAHAQSFGLAIDYMSFARRLVQVLVEDGADVLLVPHVRDVAHHAEDDAVAALSLRASLPSHVAHHVALAAEDLAADEVKWVIGKLDWFCGTRMHSAIAALSQGIPTAAVAYSMKTQGVFATCGVADEVVDGRRTGSDEAVARLRDAFARKTEVRSVLQQTVPGVVEAARRQVRDALAQILDRSSQLVELQS